MSSCCLRLCAAMQPGDGLLDVLFHMRKRGCCTCSSTDFCMENLHPYPPGSLSSPAGVLCMEMLMITCQSSRRSLWACQAGIGCIKGCPKVGLCRRHHKSSMRWCLGQREQSIRGGV